jgi:hypothetical protein
MNIWELFVLWYLFGVVLLLFKLNRYRKMSKEERAKYIAQYLPRRTSVKLYRLFIILILLISPFINTFIFIYAVIYTVYELIKMAVKIT